jgi:GNAT superfamily N-acetyltransferase
MMDRADLSTVRDLSTQLGYPTDDDALARRFARIDGAPDEALFVADDGGRVLGWIHVHPRWLLESEPYAEIGGLVVDESARRRGVGRALVSRVEAWAKERGFQRMRVRSNVMRVASHALYASLGYERIKTQHTYERVLVP